MTMCIFKKYKNILGEEGTGIHSIRFLNIALVDVILTMIIAILTTYFINIPFVLSIIMWFSLGFFTHVLFGVQTNATRLLGIKC